MTAPLVEEYSQAEAQEIIHRLGLKGPKVTPGLLGRFEGWVDAVCREKDGSIAWEVHQKNVVTDLTLKRFAFGWNGTYNLASGGNTMSNELIFISPSIDTPVPGRYVLPDDGTGVTIAIGGNGHTGNSTYTYNGSTYTWTYTYTFTGANRRIGTIGLCSSWAVVNNAWGPGFIWAYSLLNPVKNQTSTQTVETAYRITLIPSW